MESCRAGIITMDYQPGHPHGFCSAIWMGEIAYCQPLRDPQDLINRLESIALPYPQPLRNALIRRFQWEILFGIENAELAAARNEQTHYRRMRLPVAGLRCADRVRTERALSHQREGCAMEAARLPLTIPHLDEQATEIWRLIGNGALATACDVLRQIDRQLKALTRSSEQQP
ncbi:hypothetical protein BST65_32780 [Bradyrhizobium canariense]|nr:hypothetical protein BST65_32780 [Bradyrhizobium canariense]OSI34424.1 hypothetical protein BST66_10300 [Bradyrhizobium canariense]OSI39678.1 hypothetical protein BSZ20_29615 [Bradyrhizobium canariense]OSI47701.1 hypothetical protein BST67_20095 [Bradyrhizobium canariense]OSI56719.1 hypothetical protein BSZ15_15855 [Bradyrhizobium canariense]